MGNFSLIVQKKYNILESEQQRIFFDEFDRRKKSITTAYILWFVLGWHYAYLRKWGWLILYILSVGGLFIWAIIDLFRIPKMVDDYNNNLALEILKDINTLFSKNKIIEEPEIIQYVEQEPYSAGYTPKSNYNSTQNGSYNYLIFIGIIALIIAVGAFMKPTKLKMQNQIVDKFMANDPEMAKIVKNLFFGKDLNLRYTDNYIFNRLESSGYKNVTTEESNWIILRKLNYRNNDSGKVLISAYGLYGATIVSLDYDYEKTNNNHQSEKRISESKTRGSSSYEQDYQNIEPNSKTSSTSNEKNIFYEVGNTGLKYRKESELKEDSIKIDY